MFFLGKQNIHFLTPERHEDGEEDGALVVEEVHDLRVETSLLQLPVFAEVVAGRTHVHGLVPTNLLTGKRAKEHFRRFSYIN